MSDPVSNAEIEDVLSSIRRLISADQADKPDSGEPASPTDNKLILTPAFRVFDGVLVDASEVDRNEAATQNGSVRDIPVEKLGQGDLAAADTDGKSVDAGEDQDHAPFDLTIAPDAVEPGLQSSTDMPMPPADSQVDFEDNWDSDALGETAQVAFLHERLSRSAADASPKDAEEETTAAEASDPVVAPDVEELAHDDTDDALELIIDQDGVEDEDISDDESVLNTVGEALIDDAEAASDVDSIDADDPTRELAEENTDAESFVGSVEVEEAPVAEIVEDDTDFIDEAYLQEIVSRIVREELKGEIGVKITQAVRRMVRREVTRALSLEKFD
ncbi:hypothetical protein [Aliiroseovarius sp. S253]|uniref:hypothetical protein n=1 Tax=Aliiroseovarius sp. S253 TaxID=3415133 RepID=UPI003C798C94